MRSPAPAACASAPRPPKVHATWVQAKLARLDELLRGDPVRARIEIARHLDGDLVVSPLLSLVGMPKRAEIQGRAIVGSLFGAEEVRLSVEPGARYGRGASPAKAPTCTI